VAFIFNTHITFDEMLNVALLDLGLAQAEKPLPKIEALQQLNVFATRHLARGGSVVLLVDEAQNLDRACLENLRLLSNLETRKHKLIQIVLSGQPELDQKLGRPELRQLAQRISLKRYIKPLGEEATYKYIVHRLKVAGYCGPPLFDRKAQELIWRYSKGVPRRINMLCDNALLIGFALRNKKIQKGELQEAISDLRWSPFSGSGKAHAAPVARPLVPPQQKTSRSGLIRASGLAVAAVYLLAAGFFVGRHWLNSGKSGPIPVPTATRVEALIPQDSPDPHTAFEEGVEEPVEFQQSETGQAMALSEKPEAEGASVLTNPTNSTKFLEDSEKPRPGEPRIAIVRKGDSLSRIIIRTYGTYNRAVLDAVLEANPGIENPNQIEVGQAIKLPGE
jgi:general secretion pathway protein A